MFTGMFHLFTECVVIMVVVNIACFDLCNVFISGGYNKMARYIFK